MPKFRATIEIEYEDENTDVNTEQKDLDTDPISFVAFFDGQITRKEVEQIED